MAANVNDTDGPPANARVGGKVRSAVVALLGRFQRAREGFEVMRGGTGSAPGDALSEAGSVPASPLRSVVVASPAGLVCASPAARSSTFDVDLQLPAAMGTDATDLIAGL
eukprot:40133-Prymnesium_polylepis.1